MVAARCLDRIAHNWAAKASSILLAFLLVQFYSGSLLEQRAISVPLVVRNEGALTPALRFPQKVTVLMRASRDTLGALRGSDIVPYVDLSSYTEEGEYAVPVRVTVADHVAPPDALELVADPAIIPFKLERSVTKNIPITLSLEGVPAYGYELREVDTNPSMVEIRGPASLLVSYTQAVTETLDITNRRASFSGVIGLINPSTLVSFPKTKTQFVVRVREVSELKELETTHVSFTDCAPHLTFSIEPVTIRAQVQVPKHVIEEMHPEEFFSVSAREITEPGRVTAPLILSLPEHVRMVQYSPKEVHVHVREAQSVPADGHE
ncbi:conserved hypothetical protein [Treponema paraluiscuniculi Cuniculi A]|uniref:YbbR family protein n=2 Tax=Treponema paraluiscuniculi TaxID=53435 RepID=F7XTN5_TREPU|nr:CdaR family protein [Treponema paraluiscuniculi]AEH40753.1 conserved hypothetical protein [Treponema paraluiscuniculi Cuniculi A]WKC72682.1 hypothetical protein TPLL2_0827 [Treponema paraluiscuniculi]